MAVNAAFMLYVAEVLTVKSKQQGAGAGGISTASARVDR